MERLALVPLLIIPTVFALALTGGLASGGGSLPEPVSIEVAVNIESDPGGHAEFIDMPENIKLTLTQGPSIVGQIPIGLTVSGPPPWVTVADPTFTFVQPIPIVDVDTLDATGMGTVAGIDNVAVRFTGTYDPENPFGEVFTGFYTMGVQREGANKLPGGQPIEYRIKPKPGGPPAPTATVPGMGAPTDTPVPPPALTPTPTVPGMGAPTDTPVPYDMSIVAKVDADTRLLMEGWEMKIYAGDGCTGSPILTGPTDALTPSDSMPFSSGYFVLLPPGDYSVAETQQPGWERVETPFCQDFNPGDFVFFQNRRIRNGDVNCDGNANAIDASLMLQLQADLVEQLECEAAGDTNEDGTLNAVDTALLLQFTAGLIPSLPVGSGPTPDTPTPTPTPPAAPTSTPTASPTPPPPAATSTDTPTPTPTANTGKVSITVEGGPGRHIEVFQGDGCTGSAFASLTVNGSLSLSFSPGSYSIMAGDVEGWELAEGVDACQDVTLTAGQKTDVTFTYQQVAGAAA